ncbi:MAG: hypothetical protein ACOC3V_01370 [bacterium]
MGNNVEDALNKFNNDSNDELEKNENKNVKKVVLDEREGLIERVDRVYVDKSGRQLLRERY